MLDELRDLFFRALKFDSKDKFDRIPLIREWNEAVDHVQEVFNHVKRLRADADYMDNNGIMLYAAAPFYRECADAIEELQQTAKHYKGCSDDWYREACDYKAMLPRWIPVTEKKPPLPEGEDICFVDVIAAIRGRKESAQVKYCRAYRYLDGKRECIERFIDDWEVVDVTHWMPLPEPPEEEV